MNMKKIIQISVIILLAVSCRKNDIETIEGPNLNDLYGPFNILSNLKLDENVNFTNNESVIFNMEISNDVTLWGRNYRTLRKSI